MVHQDDCIICLVSHAIIASAVKRAYRTMMVMGSAMAGGYVLVQLARVLTKSSSFVRDFSLTAVAAEFNCKLGAMT